MWTLIFTQYMNYKSNGMQKHIPCQLHACSHALLCGFAVDGWQSQPSSCSLYYYVYMMCTLFALTAHLGGVACCIMRWSKLACNMVWQVMSRDSSGPGRSDFQAQFEAATCWEACIDEGYQAWPQSILTYQAASGLTLAFHSWLV